MTHGEILNFYRQPGTMTSAAGHTAVLDSLPASVEDLASVVQEFMLHEDWTPAFGQILSNERRGHAHTRATSEVLEHVLDNGVQRISHDTPLDDRYIGNCRTFSVLMVTFLRAKGIPARPRCGFGAYFNEGTYEDHWVSEYWNSAESRWILVDAQVDNFQRERLVIDFDVLDVPRDRFIGAGDAWAHCRAGGADPAAFGIGEMRGLWFVAGNVARDLAALNNMEMLPWDVWGMIPGSAGDLAAAHPALYDRIATIVREPDAHFAALRELYTDNRFRVPPTVFNALRSRPEAI